jgi:hypothetical protein
VTRARVDGNEPLQELDGGGLGSLGRSENALVASGGGCPRHD